MLLANVLPSQREDFVPTRACKCQQADRSDHPWRAGFFLLSFSQGVTQPMVRIPLAAPVNQGVAEDFGFSGIRPANDLLTPLTLRPRID